MRILILMYLMSTLNIIFPQTGVAPAGSGTPENPYLVATWQNLLWIQEDVTRWDKHYRQTADIDFNTASPAISTWNSNTGWMPIGTEAVKFTGSFDGQGYDISNLYMNRTSGGSIIQGFFGYSSAAIFSNIHLSGNFTFQGVLAIRTAGLVGFVQGGSVTNCTITGSVNVTLIGQSGGFMGVELYGWVGGLIGNMSGGTFTGNSSNCTISAHITNGSGMSTSTSIGQLVGEIVNATVSNCSSSGTLSVTGDFSEFYSIEIAAGGAFGIVWGTPVSNCFSSCAITGSQLLGDYGGLAGNIHNASSQVTDCYATGYIQGYASGGFAGLINEGTVSRCYASGNILGSRYLGGFVGNVGFTANINNCYSRGTVTRITGSTNGEVGGFTGRLYNATLNRCYSTGAVIYQGTTNPTDKGFCGWFDRFTGANSFWDTQTSSQATTFGSGMATGKTTVEMKTQTTFTDAGWDFTGESTNGTNDYWKVDALINDGYPALSWQTQTIVAPTMQASNLLFSNTTSGEQKNIVLSFTASADAERYVIVRSTGDFFPTFTPVDGVEYSAGAQGTDMIVYVGTGVTASDDNVNLALAYRYKIFAFNGSGAGTKYLTTEPLSGYSLNSTGDTELPSGSGTVGAGFPGAGVTVTFPSGTSGTTLSASRTASIPTSNFAALPGVRGVKNLYFTINSTSATPGGYTLVLDFSSLELSQAQWNKFKVLKRGSATEAWVDVTAAPLSATIVSRQTDGVWGKFTISGLNSFSEFGGGEECSTITVTSNSDSGPGTLRQALTDATAGDVITFSSGMTITLATPLFIDKDITIRGIGEGVTLNGGGAVKVMQIGTMVTEPLSPIVRLEKLKITGGNDTENRVGGIDNYGSLTMVNCLVAGNIDVDINAGTGAVGGILSNGDLYLVNCTITDNIGASSDGGIGGIYCDGNFYSYNSILFGNSGEYGNIAFANISESYHTLFGESEGMLLDDNSVIFLDPLKKVNNLFGSDPLFVGAGGSATHPYSIQLTSPCTDAGDNSFCFEVTDHKGDGRKLNSLTGNTGGTIDIGAYEFNFNNPLPVELSAFSATVSGQNIVLTWTTKTEVSNYGFEIERSSGPQEEWNVIGFVSGSGNSNSPKTYQYTDEYIATGSYLYRLKQIDTDGAVEYSIPLTVVMSSLPTEFTLMQNFPNPFNPSTHIRYALPSSGRVTLKIYDMLGSELETLVEGYQDAGYYEVQWNGANHSSGVYIYRIQSGEFSAVRKLILAK